MKNAPTDGAHSRAADAVTVADLRARLADAPPTKRTKEVEDYLRIAETYTGLAATILKNGCEDRPTTLHRKPTWTQRLRLALESGTFKAPNAAALLTDLNRVQGGDRRAQERIVDYLNLPGVLEALDD